MLCSDKATMHFAFFRRIHHNILLAPAGTLISISTITQTPPPLSQSTAPLQYAAGNALRTACTRCTQMPSRAFRPLPSPHIFPFRLPCPWSAPSGYTGKNTPGSGCFPDISPRSSGRLCRGWPPNFGSPPPPFPAPPFPPRLRARIPSYTRCYPEAAPCFPCR